jgi:hypothetical protein
MCFSHWPPTSKRENPWSCGFNNEFIKNYWGIIANDVRALVGDFYDGNLSMKSINSSYITLISKVENPTTPGDFRPITHLNSALKIITKLLANGL